VLRVRCVTSGGYLKARLAQVKVEILKSHLGTNMHMENDYRADLWEFPRGLNVSEVR